MMDYCPMPESWPKRTQRAMDWCVLWFFSVVLGAAIGVLRIIRGKRGAKG